MYFLSLFFLSLFPSTAFFLLNKRECNCVQEKRNTIPQMKSVLNYATWLLAKFLLKLHTQHSAAIELKSFFNCWLKLVVVAWTTYWLLCMLCCLLLLKFPFKFALKQLPSPLTTTTYHTKHQNAKKESMNDGPYWFFTFCNKKLTSIFYF